MEARHPLPQRRVRAEAREVLQLFVRLPALELQEPIPGRRRGRGHERSARACTRRSPLQTCARTHARACVWLRACVLARACVDEKEKTGLRTPQTAASCCGRRPTEFAKKQFPRHDMHNLVHNFELEGRVKMRGFGRSHMLAASGLGAPSPPMCCFGVGSVTGWCQHPVVNRGINRASRSGCTGAHAACAPAHRPRPRGRCQLSAWRAWGAWRACAAQPGSAQPQFARQLAQARVRARGRTAPPPPTWRPAPRLGGQRPGTRSWAWPTPRRCGRRARPATWSVSAVVGQAAALLLAQQRWRARAARACDTRAWWVGGCACGVCVWVGVGAPRCPLRICRCAARRRLGWARGTWPRLPVNFPRRAPSRLAAGACRDRNQQNLAMTQSSSGG